MADQLFTIHSYQDDPTTSGGGSPDSTFEAQINPEKFNYQASIRYNEEEGNQPGGTTKQTQGNDGGKLSVELYFDSTGVVPDGGVTVTERLEALQEAVYKVEGEIHKPMYCTVVYGDFGMHCKLESMSMEYLLFAPDGLPLRAKVSLSFVGHIDSEANQKENNLRSPDLSRILTVRQGDTLPIMCQKIYKSPFYYLQVAEINGLTNFRELEIGSQILFPPLEK